MAKSNSLTALQVQAIKEPGFYSDGAGLNLRVSKGYDPAVDKFAKKSWVFRYSRNKKAHSMGLGPLRDVSLAEARELAADCRKLLRQGLDPIQQRKKEAEAELAPGRAVPTFRECAREYILTKRSGWKNAKHAQQWENTLQTYAFPIIGNVPVDQIDVAKIRAVLSPIWNEKTETASRVRSRIENILEAAISLGLRPADNPASWSRMKSLFPSRSKVQKPKSFNALDYRRMHEFMRWLQDQDGVTAQALKFLTLTAARTGEVRFATFDEFDLSTNIWRIMPERMKADREHRVPLSDAAANIIREMQDAARSRYVFPGQSKEAPISNMTMLQLVKRGFDPNMTVHGLRSSFRDWAAEQTAYPNDVIEMSLAHTIRDKTEAAYFRSDLLEKRRKLIKDWAYFCCNGSAKAFQDDQQLI